MLESPNMADQKGTVAKLYLASNSPRRKELLSLSGLEYNILSLQVDETPVLDEDGREYVQRLANSKVVAAASQAGDDAIIIAADTTVVDSQGEGKSMILGKPSDEAEAIAMLQALRGHTHQVYTAISILSTQNGTILCDLCTTDVPMRNYSDEEIERYVTSGDPFDKAGAYAIQHAGFHPVEMLAGCFANVMGLPLCHLTRNLVSLGITPREDVPGACQASLGYNCPVYAQILEEKIHDYTCG